MKYIPVLGIVGTSSGLVGGFLDPDRATASVKFASAVAGLAVALTTWLIIVWRWWREKKRADKMDKFYNGGDL
jgi:membrane protein DedA with SNARE-associated domain